MPIHFSCWHINTQYTLHSISVCIIAKVAKFMGEDNFPKTDDQKFSRKFSCSEIVELLLKIKSWRFVSIYSFYNLFVLKSPIAAKNQKLEGMSKNNVLVKSRQTHHTYSSALEVKDTKRFLQIGTRDLRYNKLFRSKKSVT